MLPTLKIFECRSRIIEIKRAINNTIKLDTFVFQELGQILEIEPRAS